MNIIQQRSSAGGALSDLDESLGVIQGLISQYGIDISNDTYLSHISEVSPDVASLIKVLSQLDMLRSSVIKSLRSTIQQDQGYVVQTSHPDIIKNSLGEVQSIQVQSSVGVQVSKGGNIYKRSLESDIDKLLV